MDNPQAQHLQTYFLFPFSIDREAVAADHPDLFAKRPHWFAGVDDWVKRGGQSSRIQSQLGAWQRGPFSSFEAESDQAMSVFHPFVRRVFFGNAMADEDAGERDSLVRSFRMPLARLRENNRTLRYEARDAHGRSMSVEVTDLQLSIAANGIGILSISIEALDTPIGDALWINEMLRKVYPSSSRQIREARTLLSAALVIEGSGVRDVLVEDNFERLTAQADVQPLSGLITKLLYFAHYTDSQFDPVLGERMNVYSYLAIDPASVPKDYHLSEEYQVLMSRFLYVDLWNGDYRYEAEFTRAQMQSDVYRRWAHQGTLYGFTSCSSVVLAMGEGDRGEHGARDGSLILRMFRGRYFIMQRIALFYRASLLGLAEDVAITTRALFRSFNLATVYETDIRMTLQLLADVQFFNNHWFFGEITNQMEELEHYRILGKCYGLEATRREIDLETERLGSTVDRFFQQRTTEALNRLAMLSMILGGGAVITGFFGMNFGLDFEKLFFNPGENPLFHHLAIAGVSALVVVALSLAAFVVAANWRDYRSILIPTNFLTQKRGSLKRVNSSKAGKGN